MELESNGLKALYRNRFDKESEQRQETWDVLCKHFFQQWVPTDAVVLDLAAGHCEFINNIKAGRRIAVDLTPDVKVRAASGVETHVLRSDDMVDIAEQSI
ncbi:MAG: SAM-dependent methyltransferase, partial [Jatrophihabitantaceae bacterium]